MKAEAKAMMLFGAFYCLYINLRTCIGWQCYSTVNDSWYVRAGAVSRDGLDSITPIRMRDRSCMIQV